MHTFKEGWCVVYTRPQHEQKVAHQLRMLGIEYFLPMVKSLRIWSDRRKYINAPLFPSYVFVKLENIQSYFSSLELKGILHYVRNGKQIASVPESIVLNLKLLLANSNEEILVSSEYILPGKRLFVSGGPFTGFECEMIRHNGKHKILVRIDLIHRNVIVDMPLESLMPASTVLSALSA